VPSMLYGTAWMEGGTSRLCTAAIEAGFRGIDTANQVAHYDEAAVGEAIERALDAEAELRSQLFLQTKFTHPHHHRGRSLPYRIDAEPSIQVRDSLASSLRHLRTEHVDSFLLHCPVGPGRLEAVDREVWAAIAALGRTPEVGLIGVSNVLPAQLEELCDLAMPDVVQNRFQLGHHGDIEVRKLCRERGIVYQGFSIIAINRAALDSAPVRRVSAASARPPVQVLVRFAMQKGVIPVIGSTSRAHMEDVLAAVEFDLDPHQMDLLTSLDEP
jgi:diketogulonate reductase-like aldo/keto reductase